MSGCVFCKIISGEIPAKKAYEDESILAFYDVNPAAPVHLLVIPKKHIGSVEGIGSADHRTVYQILCVINRLAAETGVSDSGYRIVINNGPDGGQSVPHLHFHLLGGRSMSWPPG
ncbi:MAG: histidine triad nucleotide-binding protein [Armatimonadota bacterium]